MGQCWQHVYLTEEVCPISFTWFKLAVVPCFSIGRVRVVNLSMGMHFCLSLRIIHKDKAIFLIQAELVWPTSGVIRAAVCWPCCRCSVWRWPRPVAGAAWLTLALLQFCVLAYARIICLGVTAVLFVGFLPWIHPTGEKTLVSKAAYSLSFFPILLLHYLQPNRYHHSMTRGKLHAGVSKPLRRFSSCQESHYPSFLHWSVRKQHSLAEAISYNSPSEVGYDRHNE